MYNKIVTADIIIATCIEAKGIYKRGNPYSAYVTGGATTVRRPRLPNLVVKTTGTSAIDADRKGTKSDTEMVDTDLQPFVIPIKDELSAHFENKKIVTEFAKAAAKTMVRAWDKSFIAAAKNTTNVIQTKATGVVAWQDLVSIKKNFHKNEVDDQDLLIVVSAELEDQVMDIDVIKNAASYNTQFLSTGKLVNVMGLEIYFSGLVGKSIVNNKDCIVGMYGPGVASIVSNSGEIQEVWDIERLQTNIDFVAHAGFGLDDPRFSVVLELK